MPTPSKVTEQPLNGLAQTVSEQALVVARRELDRARRELSTRARTASVGVAMVGGGAVLGTLAAGTGTAGLVMALARRPGSAAAFGVSGLYAGAGALLARQGISRLRTPSPAVPEDTDESADTTAAELPESVESVKAAATSTAKKRPPSPKKARAATAKARPAAAKTRPAAAKTSKRAASVVSGKKA